MSRDWPIGGRVLAHLYNQNYLGGLADGYRDMEPRYFLLRQSGCAEFRLDVRQFAVVRALRRSIRHLGDGPHHAVCTAGMAISRLRVRRLTGKGKLC